MTETTKISLMCDECFHGYAYASRSERELCSACRNRIAAHRMTERLTPPRQTYSLNRDLYEDGCK